VAKSDFVEKLDMLKSTKAQTGTVVATAGTLFKSDSCEKQDDGEACQEQLNRPFAQSTGLFEEPVPPVMPNGEDQEPACHPDSWDCHEDLRDSMDVLQLACAAEEEALREVEDALRFMMKDSQRQVTESKAAQAKETALDALRQAVLAAKEDSKMALNQAGRYKDDSRTPVGHGAIRFQEHQRVPDTVYTRPRPPMGANGMTTPRMGANVHDHGPTRRGQDAGRLASRELSRASRAPAAMPIDQKPNFDLRLAPLPEAKYLQVEDRVPPTEEEMNYRNHRGLVGSPNGHIEDTKSIAPRRTGCSFSLFSCSACLEDSESSQTPVVGRTAGLAGLEAY
jgi:hypothetical protein